MARKQSKSTIEKQLAAIEYKLARLVHYPTPGYFALSPSKIKQLKARKRRLEEAYTRANPASISGWVRAKAVKIVRNKAGKAVSVKIKT